MKALSLLAALAPVAASATVFDFDDAEALRYDGSNATTASHLDNRYGGIFLSYFRGIDSSGNLDPYVPVTAVAYDDYLLPSVSGTNAIDGFQGSLIVDLNLNVFPLGSTFGITVVDQGFGNENAVVRFFDAAGVQVDQAALDLSRPGRFVYSGSAFASVRLPSGAYYDDLTVSPVPEPASLAALGLGVAALARRRARR